MTYRDYPKQSETIRDFYPFEELAQCEPQSAQFHYLQGSLSALECVNKFLLHGVSERRSIDKFDLVNGVLALQRRLVEQLERLSNQEQELNHE